MNAFICYDWAKGQEGSAKLTHVQSYGLLSPRIVAGKPITESDYATLFDRKFELAKLLE
jgi:hypothetical protein